MKQKRKVKSLNSSKNWNRGLFMALLFLLGGALCLGAVALFTSSLGVVSAEEGGSDVVYEGEDDKHEVLLNLGLIPDGHVVPNVKVVNEMYLSGNNFFMSGDAGISVNISNTNGDGYINYLGGKSMNVDSNNITIIGGDTNGVFGNNDNATILGGYRNQISGGKATVVSAPVMLGGTGNIIGEEQEGAAIVGGVDNSIGEGVSYGYVIGGQRNTINDGKNNVVVGGKDVTVNDSNVFVFSDGHAGDFEPQGGNAFYLNLGNGLGLNASSSKDGILSSGAVSFGGKRGEGQINIISQRCNDPEDVGVQGTWNGCLVGCTEKSAADDGKWEMIDHGDVCEEACKEDSNDRCIVDPIVPETPDSYTGYCTTNGVDTSNSVQCAANRLEAYENVVFETYLIDSDGQCPSGTDQQKCAFKCEGGYHLRSRIIGGTTDKKCYKDCTLPWSNEKVPHNRTGIAYNAEQVKCSNTDYVFPGMTTIVNIPSQYSANQLRNYNGMVKTATGVGKSYESCTNYAHKKNIICYDGELYIADNNGKTKHSSNTLALGSGTAWFGYDTCTITGYNCPQDIYNLSRDFIVNTLKDSANRGNTDRGFEDHTRGQYKLCQDWFTNVGNESCKTGDPGSTYHYQLIKCQNHFSTGTDSSVSEYRCMRGCSLTGLDGKAVRYEHNKTTTGYAKSSELCGPYGTGTCDARTITCNDGTWVMGGNKNGTTTNTRYLYDDCKLVKYVCDGNYNVTQAQKDSGEAAWGPHSKYYPACTPYNPDTEGRFHCEAQSKKYDLYDCDSGYHTENDLWCRDNDDTENCHTAGVYKPYGHSHYVVVSKPIYWECGAYGNVDTCWTSPGNCGWDCDRNYWYTNGRCCHNTEHYEDGGCMSDVQQRMCDDRNVPENADADYQYVDVYWQGDGYSDPDACEWTCKAGFEGENCGSACRDVVCPSSQYPFTPGNCPEHGVCNSSCTPKSASDCSEGSTVIALTSCIGNYHPNEAKTACVEDTDPCEEYTLSTCPTGWSCDQCTNGKYKKTGCDTENGYHQSGTSCVKDEIYCTQSGGPTNSHYINTDVPVAVAGNCDWDCDCGYYESSTASACYRCPTGQYSQAGATSCSYCPSGKEPNANQCGCVSQSCTPSKTCASYGYSSSPSGSCYAVKYNVSDGCSNSLTCYVNGCSANGHDGYNCYPNSQDFEADKNACGDENFDVEALSHGYCAKCDGNIGSTSCRSPCGHGDIAAGTTDICYSDGNPACSSASNPCDSNYQQRTCGSDGMWSASWGASYIYGSCTPKASGSCSETEYPLDTQDVSNVKSWNTPCVYYTVSSNSCKKEERYSIKECIAGYHPNETWTACVEDTDPCEDYTLATCPTGWVCEQCTNGKFKKTGCDTENGYTLYNGSCVIKDCSVSCGSKYFTCITANGSIMSPINPRQYGANDLAQFKWDCGPANGCTEGITGCACNATSCSSRGLSNNHDGYNCYQQLVPDDTCMGSVFCYSNGCAANGYNGYTCYATNDNVDIFDHPELYDIHALTNGYCVKAKSVDQCASYTLDACPTHASCDDCTSNGVKKYKITSCHPEEGQCFGGLPSDQRKTYCPGNANCSECAIYYKQGDSCVTTSSLFKITSCKDSNYTVVDNECVSCTQATQGWTQGTPPTGNCHAYYTKNVCGSNYYIDRGYQCGAGEVCNNGVCSSEPECQGTLISQSSVQYYQDVLGYECNCDGDRCCCDAP